jgi:hypothetical protein
MTQSIEQRRSTSIKRMAKELTAIRITLESIQLSFDRWLLSQGQPSTVADDRVPHAIELHATKKVG